MPCACEFAAGELAWREKALQDKTCVSHQPLPEISTKQKRQRDDPAGLSSLTRGS